MDENFTIPKVKPGAFKPAKIDGHLENEKIAAPSLSYLQDSWRRLKKNKVAMVSLMILIFTVIIAIIGSFIAPYNYATQQTQYANLPPRIPGLSQLGIFDGRAAVGGYDAYARAGVPDNINFFFGTDALGRDLFSRSLYGISVSLFIGLVAAAVDLVIGVPYGIISAWKGGKVDIIMQRIIEVLSGVPNLVVVILLLLVLKPGISSIIIAIAITEWIGMARLVRAETLRLKEQEYVLAARALGESSTQIALKHILPNILGVVIIQAIISIPAAIFFEAFLSFIGLGIPAPQASLGSLINDGYKTFRFLPHLMWFPAGILCLVMVSFNMLANGLRDALDPKTND